ncbi:hypothetical protein M3Y95_00021200 [Aphelenchoides besseyi]|nr:hypothetical protein M3Y95_00021200 [Aphelenchoides besseyi]
MTTNSSPTIFEAYSPANVRSASFHHHQARVHPQPSFRSTPPISSPICRQAQLISNATKFAKIGNQSRLHSHNSCESSPRLVERCVVVAKQQDGYGLLVTGEHPVYVESVKPEGAAARAGVRQGDQIVKINGMPVSSSNHYEVLRMISAGPNVCLTLLGEPLSCKTCRPIFFDSAFFEESRTKKSSGELPHHADSEHESPKEGNRPTFERIDQNIERVKRLDSNEGVHGSQETSSDEHLSIDDKVEPVRQWVNSGGKHYAAASSSRDVMSSVGVESEDEEVNVALNEQNLSAPNTAIGNIGHPFGNAGLLKRNPAELALFLHFTVHQADPTSTLFYLITDAYQSCNASLKELRRYSYEIFSTFLIPSAPLQVPGITQLQIQSIDRILGAMNNNSAYHDPEQLKKVFVSARSRALTSMEELFAEYTQQKSLGALSSKVDLIESNQTTRHRIAEQILFKLIEELFHLADNDLEKCDAHTLALIMSIATVLKVLLNIKPSQPHWEKLMEKCPTFVTCSSKAGVFRMKPIMSKKTVIVKDHQFTLSPVYLTVLCYQCRDAVWGVNPQAYFCQNCDVVVHKQCTGRLVDRCYPATQKSKSTSANRQTRLRTSSALNLSSPPSSSTTQTASGYHTPRHHTPQQVYQPSHRGIPNATSSITVAPVRKDHSHPPDSRSMGYDPTSQSKHIFAHMESVLSPSDLPPSNAPPAIPTATTSSSTGAAETGILGAISTVHRLHSNANRPSGSHVVENAKSTSSDSGIGAEMEQRPISRSQSVKRDRLLSPQIEEHPHLESDAENSLVHTRGLDVRSVSGSSSQSINPDEARHMLERVEAMAEDDSDLDADVDIPPLDQVISWQVLKRIDPKLRKLQEGINEFYHTERTHVRNLKVLCRVFFKPIVEQKLGSREFVKIVFGNLDELLEVHSNMFQKMKIANEQWKKDPEYNGLYGKMGGTISSFFNNEDGDRLRKATSAFCQDQQHALRVLSDRRSKDESLAAFLAKAEANPLCRKFQLKDLLPVEMQRLAKYPLLLDAIIRYTMESSEECQQYTQATIGAKRLLSAVNTAKRDTENRRYLEEIAKRIEMPIGNRPSDVFIRKFDIMQYRYVYDGDVTWRHSRGKSDMRLILLDYLLILLTKGNDGKYYMRTQETNAVPLLWLPSVTIEEKAGDKRTFVIFYERDLRSYELQAQSLMEKKTWEQLLKSQIAAAKDELPNNFESDIVSLMPRLRSGQQSSTDDSGGMTPNETAEKVHVTTHPRLVKANEIVVQQPTILEHARPMMTPTERLHRTDKVIVNALAEKHTIITEQLINEKKLTPEELESIAEMLSGMSTIELKNRNPAELALSAIVHVNRLVDSINTRMNNRRQDSDKVAEEAERYLPYVPCYRLTAIAAPLLNHLTALSHVIKEQREELASLKREINKNRLEAANASERSVSEETLTETTTGGVLVSSPRTIN